MMIRVSQLLQILGDLSTKHLIKLILSENDMTLIKLKRRPVYFNF